VLLTIRGTLGIEDLLTDLKCNYGPLKWRGKAWTARGGMLKCAEAIICVRPALLGILLSERGIKGHFVTCSKCPTLDDRHAASNGYPLRLDLLIPPGRGIHCCSYGLPASISSVLRAKKIELVTSVVYDREIAPSGIFNRLRLLSKQKETEDLYPCESCPPCCWSASRKKATLSTHSRELTIMYAGLLSSRKMMTNENFYRQVKCIMFRVRVFLRPTRVEYARRHVLSAET
jgi:hypothetical protein